MRKIFTLFLSVLFVSAAFAQKPEAVIKKATVDPVVDGVFDDVWAITDSNLVDKNYRTEVPTFGDVGDTYWKALWNDEGIFIIIKVNDDGWRPAYLTGAGDNWMYDKPEIYFDVNYVLEDAKGASAGAGHYQVAPTASQAKIDGTATTETDGTIWSFKVDDPTWVAEYFVPFSRLKDSEGIEVDKTGNIGFDVTLIDKDASDDIGARRRAVWANVGGKDESWSNMDDCGIITLEGAVAGTEVSSIALTGGKITADNGTLQIAAVVLPEDASNKVLKWSVATKEGSTGRATISSTGLVSAIMDGVVTVTGASTDGSFIEATVDVTISGQVIQVADVNIIKNGNFDNVDAGGQPVGWGGWIDGDYGTPWTVVDGAASCTINKLHATEPWHYQFSQANLTALPDVPYLLNFKAWASKNRQINFDFEDTSSNGYNRYGVSSDPTSTGESEWNLDLTTEPKWFKLHVTFTEMIPSTVQKIQYMFSKDDGTIYLDSISLISEADMALVPTAIAQNNAASFKVYPNPAASRLYVDLSVANSTVAIYNSVGVKMEEVVVNGTRHQFDVSRYTKGLYFVKANNAVVKFVK